MLYYWTLNYYVIYLFLLIPTFLEKLSKFDPKNSPKNKYTSFITRSRSGLVRAKGIVTNEKSCILPRSTVCICMNMCLLCVLNNLIQLLHLKCFSYEPFTRDSTWLFYFCAFTKNNLSFILSWILYYDRWVLISDTNNSLCNQRKMRAFLGSVWLKFFMVNWLDHKKIRSFHNYRLWWPPLQGITLHTFYML